MPDSSSGASIPDLPAPAGTRASRRDQYLTPNQVADRLLVAPVTVRLWAKRGLLRSETTPGGHRRFRVQDVEEFTHRRRLVQDSPGFSPRLLLIDDDAQYTRYLQGLLATRAPHLQVDTAPDGFTAGIKCEALRPDIVTLDLHMPEMNGIEVCRLLRKMFGDDKPRIVILSGFLSEENIRLAILAGASTCVSKTVPAEVLLQALGIPALIKKAAGM